jgi:hypothetical protein
MTSHNTTPCLPRSEIETTGRLFDNWFDPIEAGLRDRTREFLQAMFEAELEEVLARSRYSRRAKPLSGDSEEAAVTGHRHGHRSRSLLGTFGKVKIAVPRPAEQPRWQDHRVEEPGAAGLSKHRGRGATCSRSHHLK